MKALYEEFEVMKILYKFLFDFDLKFLKDLSLEQVEVKRVVILLVLLIITIVGVVVFCYIKGFVKQIGKFYETKGGSGADKFIDKYLRKDVKKKMSKSKSKTSKSKSQTKSKKTYKRKRKKHKVKDP